jgi:hypothetical protein
VTRKFRQNAKRPGAPCQEGHRGAFGIATSISP